MRKPAYLFDVAVSEILVRERMHTAAKSDLSCTATPTAAGCDAMQSDAMRSRLRMQMAATLQKEIHCMSRIQQSDGV